MEDSVETVLAHCNRAEVNVYVGALVDIISRKTFYLYLHF